MPIFALAFGSFGDFEATIGLVIRIAILLRNGCKPSNECADTEKELKVLYNDLILAQSALQLAPLVAERIRREVVQCHAIMAGFFTKVTAHQGFFQRIWSAASEEKVLARFRMQIIERRAAVGLVVGLLNSGVLRAVQDRIGEVHSQVDAGNDRVGEVHDGVVSVRDRISEVHDGVLSVQDRVGEVHDGVLSIQNHVVEARDEMRGMRSLMTQMLTVISHVPHGVSEATFFVLLPNGKLIPISLLFCTSFEDVDRLVGMYTQIEWERNLRANRFLVEIKITRRVLILNYVAPDGHTMPRSQFITAVQPGILLELRLSVAKIVRPLVSGSPAESHEKMQQKGDSHSSTHALRSFLSDELEDEERHTKVVWKYHSSIHPLASCLPDDLEKMPDMEFERYEEAQNTRESSNAA
ncbi:hypothetical protein B0H11DRAFT_2186308 [Mycena galericulata]|nr:hypothetical protein B0H11DRAFT_2186308 [Mycena galericulata]